MEDTYESQLEEARRHNAAFFRSLDFDTVLAEYLAKEHPSKRGDIFVTLCCLILYVQGKSARRFTVDWVVEHLGQPDHRYFVVPDDGSLRLAYVLKYDCQCKEEHLGTLKIRDGIVAGFGTSTPREHPTSAST